MPVCLCPLPPRADLQNVHTRGPKLGPHVRTLTQRTFLRYLTPQRSLLLVLTLLSFAPQLQRLRTRQTSSGISTRYTLLQLIYATEQFAIALFVALHAHKMQYIAHTPRTAGDAINLAQTTVLALAWLGVASAVLYLPSAHRDMGRSAAVTIFVVYVLTSIGPVVLLATPLDHDDDYLCDYFSAVWYVAHAILFSPIVLCFGLLAPVFQVLEMRGWAWDALHVRGLAVQSGIFMVIGVAWVGRIRYPYEKVDELSWRALSTWFEFGGWAAVYNVVFAVGQAAVLGAVLRWRRQEKAMESLLRE
jgi:hypothetical protein